MIAITENKLDLGLVDVAADWFRPSVRGGWDWSDTLTIAKQYVDTSLSRAILRIDASQMQRSMDAHSQCERLAEHLGSDHSFVSIEPIVEFEVCHDLFNRIERACILMRGLNRRYAVIHVPRVGPDLGNDVIKPIVREVLGMGLVPVIAGTEFSQRYRRRPSLVDELREAGGLIRLSSACFGNPNEAANSRYCRRLIQNGRCDLIGSAYSTGLKIQSQITSPSIAESTVVRWAGKKTAHQIFRVNANLFFEEELGSPTTGTKLGTRRWWGTW